MMQLTTELSVYLILINVITFLTFGIDKKRARQRQWRIKESSLLTLAALGGSVGALLGMRVWHHKTKHLKFTVTVPLLLLLHIALLYFLLD